MKTIIVKTQAEFDALPPRFDQWTRIEIRSTEKIYISVKRGNSSVVARENSSVVAQGNSSVEAWGNSSVEAWENSSVEARENSSVEARENSSVEAWGNSSVEAWENSSVEAWENSSVVARENSSVEAWGNSSVEAWENSSVVARENSSVEARENSSVVAWGNSSVVAWENSSVEAYQFALIAVLASTVIIKHLADFAVASLRGVKPPIHKRDETATIVETPKLHELKISFETWLERGWVVADGIHQKLVSRKKLKDIEVFTVQDFPKKKQSFVVKRGDTFSHGETVEKAIEDLRYKISDRDTSRFESWTLKTEVPIEDAIQSYRMITGACEFGTKQFCSGIELPEKITVAEIIKKTQGQFGSREYAKFFEARA